MCKITGICCWGVLFESLWLRKFIPKLVELAEMPQSCRVWGGVAWVDALSDVITYSNDVWLMPGLRKGFQTLFTFFLYMEIYIYHTFMLPGPKPNTVFIHLVPQILWSAFCQDLLLNDVRIQALSDFLTGYNQNFNNVGSMKPRLKLIPCDMNMYKDIKFSSGRDFLHVLLKTVVLWNKDFLAATFQFIFNWLSLRLSALL